MANVRELFDQKYTSRLIMVLRMLDGDPVKIEKYWQNRLDNPTPEDLEAQKMIPALFHRLTPDAAVDAMRHNVISEIERLFFQRIPREIAVGICNALDITQLSLLQIDPKEEALTYHAYRFCDAWNKHNPDQSPIQRPHVDIG